MFHSCFWLLDNHTGESGGSPAPVREVSDVGLLLSTAQSSPRVHLSGVGVVPVLPSTSHPPSPHFHFQDMTCRRSRIHASPAVSEPQPVLRGGAIFFPNRSCFCLGKGSWIQSPRTRVGCSSWRPPRAHKAPGCQCNWMAP